MCCVRPSDFTIINKHSAHTHTHTHTHIHTHTILVFRINHTHLPIDSIGGHGYKPSTIYATGNADDKPYTSKTPTTNMNTKSSPNFISISEENRTFFYFFAGLVHANDIINNTVNWL